MATIVWFAMLGVGLFLLSRYKYTPGRAADAPLRWPTASVLERDPARPTLVLFAHPYCPCTKASLEEYDAIVRGAGDAVRAYVVVADLEEAGDAREMLARVAKMDGVRMHLDSAGAEAARFHARTSGQTVLYDPRGELVFEGGVTSARGHIGDSIGKRRVTELLRPGVRSALGAHGAEPFETSVYGCALEGPPR